MTTNVEVQLLTSGGTIARETSQVISTVESQGSQPAVSLVVNHEVVSGSAYRNKIQVGSLLDQRLRMREPLTVNIEQGDKFYVAKHEELSECGYGDDPISALQDMRKNIAELYWRLKEDQQRTDQDSIRSWQKLSEIIYEI